MMEETLARCPVDFDGDRGPRNSIFWEAMNCIGDTLSALTRRRHRRHHHHHDHAEEHRQAAQAASFIRGAGRVVEAIAKRAI
jgi:hypothetical protein